MPGFLGSPTSPGSVARTPQAATGQAAVSNVVENKTRLINPASVAPTIATFTGSGGLASGGTATAVHAQRDVATGGVTLGGAAVLAHAQQHTASGGLAAAGAATPTHRQIVVGSGGVATGGAGVAIRRQTVTANGGLVSGGAATATIARVGLTSGGATFGGVALVQTRPVRYVGSGGASVGGAAATITVRVVSGLGGTAVAGTAVFQHISGHLANGGLTAAGTATAVRGLAAVGAGGLAAGGQAGAETRPTRDSYAGAGGVVLSGSALAVPLVTRTYDAAGGAVFGGAAIATMFDASQPQPQPQPAPAPVVFAPGAGDVGFRRAQIRELTRERLRIRDLKSERGRDITPQPTRAIVVRAHVATGGLAIGGAAIVEVVYAATFVAEIVACDAPLGIVTLTDAISEVTRYYADIWPALAAHLADRPVATKRYIQRDAIYERDGWPEMPDTIARVAVPRRKGGPDHLTPIFNTREDLGWVLAHVGDVELHTYSKRASSDRPDWMVFDLDPGDGCDMVDCARAAIVIRNALEPHGLACVVKTSGSKGLHVLVPLDGPTFEDVRNFARPFAKLLATEHPTLTHQIPRAERRGKVFIDWTGNGPRRSLAAPYTWRKTSGADDVSTPLTWAEVESLSSPVRFSLDAVRARVERGDPWADVPRGTLVSNLAVALADDDDLTIGRGIWAA